MFTIMSHGLLKINWLRTHEVFKINKYCGLILQEEKKFLVEWGEVTSTFCLIFLT